MNSVDNVVAWVGVIIAGALALILAWRPPSKHEPDIGGTSKFAYNLSLVLIAAMLAAVIYDGAASFGFSSLTQFLIATLFLATIGVFLYVLLTVTLTYELEEIRSGSAHIQKIVGGLWLTPRAKSEYRSGKTIQEILLETSYEPDRVWPRLSRGLGILLVVLAYVMLMVGLSSSLAASAVLVSKATGQGVAIEAPKTSPP